MIGTYLAGRACTGRLPRIQPPMIVRQSIPHGPRVKTNPDDRLHMVRSTWTQSTSLWLIVITYDPSPGHKTFRTRVYLRPDMDEPVYDNAGFYTRTGAEWGALGALETAIRKAGHTPYEEE